jgi:hypothetical protein
MEGPRRDVAAEQRDASGRRIDETAHAIEQRRLSGAVGPDEAGDRAFFDGECDVVYGAEATVIDGDVAQRQRVSQAFPARRAVCRSRTRTAD